MDPGVGADGARLFAAETLRSTTNEARGRAGLNTGIPSDHPRASRLVNYLGSKSSVPRHSAVVRALRSSECSDASGSLDPASVGERPTRVSRTQRGSRSDGAR